MGPACRQTGESPFWGGDWENLQGDSTALFLDGTALERGIQSRQRESLKAQGDMTPGLVSYLLPHGVLARLRGTWKTMYKIADIVGKEGDANARKVEEGGSGTMRNKNL